MYGHHPTFYRRIPTGVGLGVLDIYTVECTIFAHTTVLTHFLKLYLFNRI